MKLMWVSEISQGLNACRLFTDKDFAKKRIIEEMLENGFVLFSKSYSEDGDCFLLRFVKDSEGSKTAYLSWVFRWIETEED